LKGKANKKIKMTNNFEEFRSWGFRVVYGGERFGLKESQKNKKKKKTHLDSSFCSGEQ
jgi:hypothetical protein